MARETMGPLPLCASCGLTHEAGDHGACIRALMRVLAFQQEAHEKVTSDLVERVDALEAYCRAIARENDPY